MFTDMVGFTALTQSDEAQSLAVLERHNRLLRPIFTKFRGRVVKTIGDSFLVEFDSALDATKCAVEVQRYLHDYNISSREEWKITLRIGIHLGDVVRSGDDILGDAVNIASRLQPMAEPEGVCISEQVYDQVRNKIPQSLMKLKPHELKGVKFSVDVYKVMMPWENQVTLAPEQDRNRVAVLPFANISPDPGDEYFAEGMTEELINTISHNHQLKVIARTSVGRFKGSQKSVSEIGKEIGVGTILEGSVRKAGDKIRVTAQLIDALTEEHLWSDNYDRKLDDVFSIQSEIAKSVSEALIVRLVPEERKNVEKRATESSAAYVSYLKGRNALRDRTESGLNEAKRFFEDAIAEDRDYAKAYTGLADALYLLGGRGYLPMAEAYSKGKEALGIAISLDDGLAEAHTSLANHLMHDYRYAEAENEFRRALALNPSYSLAHHWYGIYFLETGKVQDAMVETLRAEELDPLSVVLAFNMAILYAYVHDEDKTQKAVRKLRLLDPTDYYLNNALAWVSQDKGDLEGARVEMERAVSRNPEDPEYVWSLGFYSARLGLIDKAMDMLKVIDRLPDGTFGKPFYKGMIYAGLGDRDEMFRYFDLAFEERSLGFRFLRYSSLDPAIRKDPRYAALFQRANLEA
jgi:adenylate cyclase